MQVHLFTNEGIYQTTVINFLEQQTHRDKRYYVFRTRMSNCPEYSISNTSYVIYCTNLLSIIFDLIPLLLRSRWIYIHYLPYGPTLYLLYIIRRILKKSTWVIWGGDLYVYRKRKLSFRTKIYETLRRKIIPRFAEIASFIEGDALLAKRIYGAESKYRHILYPLPIELNELPEQIFNKKKEFTTILIGNSADPSNYHIEALKVLSKFKKEKVQVICPLSYYSDQNYIKEVISTGTSLFGHNFIALTEFMSKRKYTKLLEETDICIMNHDRQQALGNIIPLLYMGKKLYLRKGITTYSFLSAIKCAVFDIYTIEKSTWLDFIHFDENAARNNKKVINSAASMERCKELWKNLLDRKEK